MHKSVMLNEVIEYLNLKPGSRIIDATLNGGGHTEGILERFPDTKILGIEWDSDVFQEFLTKEIADKITAVNDSYVNLKKICGQNSFEPDGIIFDLGVSSLHYEKSGRGFTFSKDEPLDMRFNPKDTPITAADLVNRESKEKLEEILKDYGEESFAKEIAENIVRSRKIKPVMMTGELVEIINRSVPAWYKKKKIHPATKTFQALRVAVNGELDNVMNGVAAAVDIVKPGGKVIVISFQGLEDRIVRELFKSKTKEGVVKWVVKGTIKPKWEEVKHNPRARSAKMKVIEKL